MQPKTKRMIAIVIAVFMILAIMAPIFAASVFASTKSQITSKQNSLTSNNNKKKEIQNKIQNVQNQKSSVLAQKKKIDSDINTLTASINKLNGEINAKNADISNKEKQISELTGRINQNTELFKTRLRVMYEKGDTSYLEVILSSKNFSDMFTRIELVRELATHDKNLINNLNADKTKVQTVKEQLVADEKALESDRQNVGQQVATEKAKEQESDQLMQKLNNDQAALEATEAKIDAEQEAIRKQIAALQKQQEEEAKQNSSGGNMGPSTYSGGQFCWPCDSRKITSPFGYRMHPTEHVYKLHEGIDISTPTGSNVYAAADGTVTVATYGSAYGYYIVINHGSGLATLYGHNSRLLVSAGQTVKRGQLIAKSGSTGNSTGPHVHFTVFLNGQYQNPMNYL